MQILKAFFFLNCARGGVSFLVTGIYQLECMVNVWDHFREKGSNAHTL